ncbi:MAG: hypothetical protein AAGE94_21520 [Acidobacteriota bacterium]
MVGPAQRSAATKTAPEARRDSRLGKLRGYNLVVLAVSVTLLNIWVASSLPLWSHQINRDKEAELIFRGMQYAEAIRVFQTRFNRYPNSLKELVEVEPRCIRQLWENPMREDGRWALIPVGQTPGQGQPVQRAGQPGQAPQPPIGGQNTGDGDGDIFGNDLEDGREGAEPGVILSADTEDPFAPPSSITIRGVYSPTSEESIHVWNGKQNIKEWLFTVELVSSKKQGTEANPGLVTPFMAWEIGRPWPAGVTPQVPQPSDQPQQQQPGQDLGGGQGGQGGQGGNANPGQGGEGGEPGLRPNQPRPDGRDLRTNAGGGTPENG